MDADVDGAFIFAGLFPGTEQFLQNASSENSSADCSEKLAKKRAARRDRSRFFVWFLTHSFVRPFFANGGTCCNNRVPS